MGVDIVTVAILGNAGGALVGLAIGVLSYRNLETPGAVPYGFLALTGSAWCLLSIWKLLATSPPMAATVDVLVRFVLAQVVVFWVTFAFVYTGRRSLLGPVRLAGVVLVANAYAVLLATNRVHGLVDAAAVPVTQNGITLFVVQRGGVYAAQLVVSNALILLGYGLIVAFLFRARNVYRRQTAIIVLGTGFPMAIATLHDLGIAYHPAIDPTPIAFAVNIGLVGWALFEDDSLSVTSLSGDNLVDNLPDPVLALDDDCLVVDYNTAATTMLDTDDPVGDPLDEIAPGLVDHIERGEVFTLAESVTYYNPQTTDIVDQFGTERGRLVVLRDVTGQQRRQDRLEALQAATQQFIEAETADTVAEMAVEFATDVLDQNAAGVFLEDDGTLEPTVVSSAVSETVDEELLYASSADDDSDLWATYETGEQRTVPLDRDGHGALETALMLPLGAHGVMAIGSHENAFASEDRRYAAVLTQTTQVALDQVERERELRQSRGSVKRRREQIEFFNGVLRHSLRNAMVVIRGRAEHVRPDLPPAKQRHLDSVADWCGKLTEMSETIRDINNTVTASEAERLAGVDLNATLSSSITALRAEYDAPSIDCHLDGDYYVQANELLDEVLLSVLRNAIDHNDADRPTVSVSVQQASDRLQVRIADDGPGMSDELKTRVFERGLTPNQTADGFGIYFVSVMMDLYGGTLWFEDNQPTGTVAVLEFRQASAADFQPPSRVRDGDRAETDERADAGGQSPDTDARRPDTDDAGADSDDVSTDTRKQP